MLAVLVLLAGACGGDDDAGPSTTEAPSPSAGDDEETTTTTAPADGPAVPSAGCEADAPTGEVTEERREVPGLTDDEGAPRWYLLTAPEGDEPLPVVVDFHGLSEGAQVHSMMTQMGGYGLEQGFVTVFPNGTGAPVMWDVGSGADSPDLPYVDALLDDVGAARCIDTSRVYATGLSNGAMMTSLLACFRADSFAAFAPVAGLETYDGCEPSDPEAIWAVHGTEDPILYFNGGVGDLSIVTEGEQAETTEPIPEADLDGDGYPAAAREWADLLGCDEPTDEELTDELIERTWSCPDGSELTFLIVVGGGHTWPGSEFSEQIVDIVGPTTTDIDANEAMWEVFQRHQLPG
ncbi:PHB depolymerase family esterase [Iamia majanohamensis]|uniref:PHB depolymerase family esterase n=1 Tax=Iamia majanohamensis TaxID=467976 RepID=A0AAF0BUN6_9ACTN|nr:PHB depolymerase family esterase [Iamia majanohamensis]WCO65950.1 PHB depolymerase family esterase [Iamia majanohamensis]